MKIKPAVIVHGGAWNIPAATHEAHRRGVEQAMRAVLELLKKEDDSLKAVMAAIRVLEDDPTFDAGTGSFLNRNAEVEMDAGIMLGKDLSCGAVAAIRNVRHPIDVAESVRSETQHVLLVGDGACQFAKEKQFENAATEELVVGREKALFERLQKMDKVRIKAFFERHDAMMRNRDTVGCVVINSKGELTAATSTGGTPYKMPGRVGDVPIPGAGFYADDSVGGLSATGWGEGILRFTLARDAAYRLSVGTELQQALAGAIKEMENKTEGDAGLIAINTKGQPAFAFNTPFIAVAHATLGGPEFAAVVGKEHPACVS